MMFMRNRVVKVKKIDHQVTYLQGENYRELKFIDAREENLEK